MKTNPNLGKWPTERYSLNVFSSVNELVFGGHQLKLCQFAFVNLIFFSFSFCHLPFFFFLLLKDQNEKHVSHLLLILFFFFLFCDLPLRAKCDATTGRIPFFSSSSSFFFLFVLLGYIIWFFSLAYTMNDQKKKKINKKKNVHAFH